MRWRPWVVGGAVLALGGANAYLLANEDIPAPASQDPHEILQEDPLLDLVYSPATRRSNLQRFGIDGRLLDQVLQRAQAIDERAGERIAALLEQATDPDALADALCGEARAALRPRYGALARLVEQRGDRRTVIDPGRASSLDAAEWARTAPVGAVYAELELARERQGDATLMALAAVLLGREQDALDRRPPWGQGVFSTWGWDALRRDDPRAEDLVREYFALMLVVLEKAQGPGGICGR